MSVRRNLSYSGAPGDRVEEIASELGITHQLDAMPSTLSGGQAQRAALARMLLGPCRAMLLDEPFSNLDRSLREELTGLVARKAAASEVPAVLVTHQLTEAVVFATVLGVLDGGTMLQLGDPGTIMARPASARVAEIVGVSPGGG
jgi:ABC-type sugar transport system ATPase subunit